jgi:dipeptidyl aminopeptidase/acylaminoacyl peptidase
MPAKRKTKKRFIKAEDLCRIKSATAVAISPDESKIAYTVENVSKDKRKYFSHIHIANCQSGESRQFTFGEVSDQGPVWSPDGRWLAFFSTRNKKSGIYIIPTEGGAEKMLLEKNGGFSDLVWTPDSTELIYVFRYNDSHAIKDEKKKNEAPLYRHITRLYYRIDAGGFRPKDHFHIWKVKVADGKDMQLTRGKYDDFNPAVSPNGKWIVYASNHDRNPDVESYRIDLFLIPIEGGKANLIPTPAGPALAPSFSPDGKKIAYLGHTNPDDAWGVTNFHVWTVGVNGKPAAKDLIPKFDRQLEDQTIGDMGEGFLRLAPQWSADGRRIYFSASDTGCTHIFYVPAGGGKPTRVTGEKCHIKSYSLNGRRRMIAAVVSDLKNPGDVQLFPAMYKGDSKAKTLTALNRELLADIDLPKMREVWFKGHDGFDLQGWLVTPPRFNRRRKYPAILEIHGGPRAQYGFTFFHEMLLLASKGYVVFYTNPRGGGGRGETFAGCITADWGSIDYEDCMAAADYLEKLPYVNGKKMGVTGGSYGGYMTNWIVGHTNRFKAAVTQRSVVDLYSFVGSSDFGYDLNREFDGFPWTNPDVYTKCSPITYAGNIRTPLLIIHSEQDLRCGIEQAEQLFTRLKLLKRTVEFVRFPEEPHGLSRHGRPDRRIARLEWILRWFKKYIK